MERTFSWLGQNRRMSKDYERLPESSEAFVYAAMVWLMVRRLAHIGHPQQRTRLPSMTHCAPSSVTVRCSSGYHPR